jgi:hypothetical protein
MPLRQISSFSPSSRSTFSEFFAFSKIIFHVGRSGPNQGILLFSDEPSRRNGQGKPDRLAANHTESRNRMKEQRNVWSARIIGNRGLQSNFQGNGMTNVIV